MNNKFVSAVQYCDYKATRKRHSKTKKKFFFSSFNDHNYTIVFYKNSKYALQLYFFFYQSVEEHMYVLFVSFCSVLVLFLFIFFLLAISISLLTTYIYTE